MEENSVMWHQISVFYFTSEGNNPSTTRSHNTLLPEIYGLDTWEATKYIS